MTIKKMVSALFLAAGLAVSVPAFSGMPGMTDTLSVVRAADGWQQNPDTLTWSYLQDDKPLTGAQEIAGEFYYFDENGIRATSRFQKIGTKTYYFNEYGMRAAGLTEIDGKTYYFDSKGVMKSGRIKINGKYYFFNPKDGALTSGYSGVVRIGKDSDVYYFFDSKKDGSLVSSKWKKYKSKYYYADAKGQIKLGTFKVNKKLYHVTPTQGRLKTYAKSAYDGKYYNASSNGVLLTGLRKVSGKQYYFNPKTGERQSGFVKVGRTTFYFSEKNGLAKTGWVPVDGKYYYFNKDFRRATGMKTINGKKYYLNPKDAGARVSNQWFQIGTKKYYFNKSGVLQTGFFDVKGKTYYSGSDGAKLLGWQIINGRKYYLDRKTGAMRLKWQYSNGRYFYLNPKRSDPSYGAARIGWAKIDGNWYYFDTDGARKTGWVTIDSSKRYYFDLKTGIMYTGKHTIDGQVYDFGTNGALTVSGAWNIKVKRSGSPTFVVVYRGNTPIKAFACSPGRPGHETPAGTFSIKDKLYWHELMGPTWGQYCSHITSDILFHSVPNLRRNDPYSLETWEYNKLGQQASAGCIRLSVRHAKWLFDNVPIGTPVTVTDSLAKPSGVTIEFPPKQDNSKSYDPTDTFVNPYNAR